MTDAGAAGDAQPGRGVRTTRPALDTLMRDHRRLLFDGDRRDFAARLPPIEPLQGGFSDFQAAVNWYQAATVRTFGYIAKGEMFPPGQLLRDENLRAALLCAHTDAQKGRWLRKRLLDMVALPACRDAYKYMRNRAGELMASYDENGSDWSDIDPEEEQHIAMRPGFSRLDAEQGRALRSLWAGFDDEDEIARWVQQLTAATYGEIGSGFAQSLVRDPTAMEALTTDSQSAVRWREMLAVGELLPKFADASRSLRAGEQTSTESEDGWRTG